MKAHQADYPVSVMCRVLGVSRSSYYAWLGRPVSARARHDASLTETIRSIHANSYRTYGSPRVHAELRDDHDVRVGRKRVARLMRQAGLQGVSRRRRYKTTVRGRARHEIPDLVDRSFGAAKPDELWVADITYIPTRSGFLFLAVVMDACTRRVVGWAMASHLRTELVLDALDMALARRKPSDGVVHHSDQGCQYTSMAFGRRCGEAGVRPSVGSVGDCYDNAMCESFFATLECELLERHAFTTHSEAKLAVFSFIEGWYNTRRRHSSIGYLSPAVFERRHQEAAAVGNRSTSNPQVVSLPPGPPSDPATIGLPGTGAGGGSTTTTMNTR